MRGGGFFGAVSVNSYECGGVRFWWRIWAVLLIFLHGVMCVFLQAVHGHVQHVTVAQL